MRRRTAAGKGPCPDLLEYHTKQLNFSDFLDFTVKNEFIILPVWRVY